MITAYELLERVLTLQLNTARVPQIYSPKSARALCPRVRSDVVRELDPSMTCRRPSFRLLRRGRNEAIPHAIAAQFADHDCRQPSGLRAAFQLLLDLPASGDREAIA